MEEARYKPVVEQNDGVGGPAKPMPPSILERFRAVLREREEELRISEDDEHGVVLDGDEIVKLYEMVLSELTFNSKPIITELTIIAGEQRLHAEGIADVICARILEVPVEQKLPSLYLLDSIVKNIGRDYIKYFSAHLPEVFCEVYRQVHTNMHPAMRHLFGTWSTVFPSSVLRKIEAHLQFTLPVNYQPSGLPSLRASGSPRPTHGIHVNPIYLEARRQFGSTDSVAPARLTSGLHAGLTSSGFDALKLPPEFGARTTRSSSSYGIGHVRPPSPSVEEFTVDKSPGRMVERASPSNSGLDYGTSRIIGKDEGMAGWKRNSDPSRYNSEVDLERPRALIDAYGIDKKDVVNHKHRKVEQLDVNGIGKSGATKTWQNTEEEEFDWEDMSPTLSDHDRHKDLFRSSLPPPGSSGRAPTIGTHGAASLVPHLRRDWLNQAQPPVVNGSSMIEQSSQGVNNTSHGIHNMTHIQGSRNSPESLKFAQSNDYSQRHHFNAAEGGKNLLKPFPGSGILPSAGVQKPYLISGCPDADAQNLQPSFASRTGYSSLDYSTPESKIISAPTHTSPWPPVDVHNSHARFPLPTFQPSGPIRSQLNTSGAANVVANQNSNKSTLSDQHLESSEGKLQISFPRFDSQQPGSIPLNQQDLGLAMNFQWQSHQSQEMSLNVGPRASVMVRPHLLAPQLNHGYVPPSHVASVGTLLRNPAPIMQQSMPNLNVPNASMHLSRVTFPPFARGAPPETSQFAPTPPNGGDYSSLFSSLMSQGLISLTSQAPEQEAVGLEFNPDLQKVRHESAITALYSDLPRQCTTCGLRFKQQEAHSSHMDWHVTKNRISRNRKQKPSRKWFVSVNMWLTGAEALGTDAVPGFLPTEDVVEKMDDEELAVPADDDQKVCALCGEPFDDFYSDETDEWMYKGAVYMNVPTGSTAGMMDKSHLGPIVHAKCRSDTSGVSSEDFKRSDTDFTEDGGQRKRMRS